MSQDKSDNPGPLQRAVQLNQQRRGEAFAKAQKAGAQWLVESRDMWDSEDDDAGVYFTACKDTATVDQIVREQPDDSRDNRILGIYAVKSELAAQGPGVKRSEWLQKRKNKEI